MTRGEFDQLIDRWMEEEKVLLRSKNKDYAQEEDVYSGFRAVAAMSGMTVYEVWKVFISKHLVAIFNHLESFEAHSESIEGRIEDARNYLLLLRGLLLDREEKI